MVEYFYFIGFVLQTQHASGEEPGRIVVRKMKYTGGRSYEQRNV